MRMFNNNSLRTLLLTVNLTLAGCSFMTSDEKPIIDTAAPTPMPTPTVLQVVPDYVDECELKCVNKSGLKKKLCLKKCQLGIKREQAKKDAQNASDSKSE